MTETKKTNKTKEETESKDQKKTPPSKFGVLGKDLGSKFSSRSDNTWRPTKRGGRNGQGKP